MRKHFLLFLLLFTNISLAQDKPIGIRLHPPFFQGDMHGAEPKENRGTEYKKFLEPSLKIAVKAGSGSGTIIYYEKSTNTAYVATCGHLWAPGTLNAEQAKEKKIKCTVLTWYKDGKKLDKPQSYEADLLFYSYTDGCDTALLKFNPDYMPEYFSVGPSNYYYSKGEQANSMGCDGAREVAHYFVEIVGLHGNNVITIKNSPRPGRSGGGLVDNNNIYIGTCWGTSQIDGSGDGFFTPLPVIHSFWKKNGYGFLLVNKEAKKVKIYDRNTKKFIEEDLILTPSF